MVVQSGRSSSLEGRWRRGVGLFADVVSRVLMGLGTFAIVAMLAVIAGNAVSRQVFGRPLAGAFELGRLLMPVVVFGGMGWTFGKVGHFRMTALQDRIGGAFERFTEVAQNAVSLALFFLISYLAYQDALASFARREYAAGAVAIPVYPARIAIALGSIVVVIAIIGRFMAPDQLTPTDDESLAFPDEQGAL